MNALKAYLRRSSRAEAIIAKRGISAWLIMICAAIMSFLMLYTLSLGNTASSVANSWRDALTDSATIRIQAPGDAMDEEAAAVLEILRTTPSIESYQEISKDDQLLLLEPWLGEDIPVEVLTLPRVFSVKTKSEGFDENAITLRLQSEAPHAVWDDHLRWRGPLLDSAHRIKTISWFSTGLIAMAFSLLIFLAVEASTSANANTIILLRQVGATDNWIRSGFERRFVIRSFFGSLVGVLVGLVAYLMIVRAQLQGSDFIQNRELGASPYLSSFLVILLCVVLGYVATRLSATRYLMRNT